MPRLDDPVLADLNRDGLIDLVRASGGYVYWYPGMSTGPSRTRCAHPRPEGADGRRRHHDRRLRTATVPLDLVWSSPRGLWVLDLAGPTTAGMLTDIRTAWGRPRSSLFALPLRSRAGGRSGEDLGAQAARCRPDVRCRSEIDPGAGRSRCGSATGVRDGFWDGQERASADSSQATERPGRGRNEDSLVRGDAVPCRVRAESGAAGPAGRSCGPTAWRALSSR